MSHGPSACTPTISSLFQFLGHITCSHTFLHGDLWDPHWTCWCQRLCPCHEPQLPPTSAGDLPMLVGRSGPVSYEVTAIFPWVLVCICGVDVSSSTVEILQSKAAGIQSQIPGAPPPVARLPGWEDCLGAQDFHSCRQNFCIVIIFQVQVPHPGICSSSHRIHQKKKKKCCRTSLLSSNGSLELTELL